MRKKDELTLEHTCMQHAHPEEMVFVLLGRDPASPIAIRAWVHERVRLGKNDYSDAQIVEAMECAATMEREGRKWVDAPITRPPGPSHLDIASAVPEKQWTTEDHEHGRCESSDYVDGWNAAREAAIAAIGAAPMIDTKAILAKAAGRDCAVLIEGVVGIADGWYRLRETR